MRLDQALVRIEFLENRNRDAVSMSRILLVAVDRLANTSHALAMMGLQSARYKEDPDYRDAVDNALAAVEMSGWKPDGGDW